jgi:nucleoside-diphosphate-sugar epimerase
MTSSTRWVADMPLPLNAARRHNASRIFVTGGSGFLGTHVVRELLARGQRVRCLVRSERAATRLLAAVRSVETSAGTIEFVFGSLSHEPVDCEWLSGCDRVVHAAGALHGAPSTLVRQNVAATRTLTEAAAECRLNRFVLVSSLTVYAPHGLRSRAVLDESCPIERTPERRGAYAYSKVAQEAVCRDVCRGALPLVIMRPGVIFGPGRTFLSDRIGPRLGRLLAVVDGDRQLPYTFVANCGSAVASAAIADTLLDDGDVFNVIDDELPTARQIVDAHRMAGGAVRVVPVPRWATTPLSRAYGWCHARSDDLLPCSLLPYVVNALYKPLRFSNARARTRLNWQPAIGLHAALQLTIQGAQPAAHEREP